MFTGIVSEIGKVKSVTRKGSSSRLGISCAGIKEDLQIGDSVSVNGVCLSAVEIATEVFFDVVGNTFSKTNIKRLKSGDPVNLEGALKMGDKLSGHMVTGHVDGERVLRRNSASSEGWVIDVGMLSGDSKYVVPRGSVSVDGVSLTIGEVHGGAFRIFLIPHTLENTILKLKKPGDYVNVEFDILAKHAANGNSGSSVTKDILRDKGFM